MLALLAGCLGGSGHAEPTVPPPSNGPAADYPMRVGDPYVIDGVSFTPSETLNYDAVGRATVAASGSSAIVAAHHTLPVPSYAEVTDLDSGRTILVRIEQRGPMNGTQLIELSPGAAAQLGISGSSPAPVRVRRVNPVEPERALLRAGQRAPERMETPKSLAAVLLRKLAQQEGTPLPPLVAPPSVMAQAQPPAQTAAPATSQPPSKPIPQPSPRPEVKAPVPAPAPTPKPQPAPKAEIHKGSLIVQVGAFSSKDRADAVATKLGGAQVSAMGKLWRVRMGPFSGQAQADAALVKARAAGYSDARIQHAE